MAIAQGINKVLAYKKESSWGVAPGATSGKELSRVTGMGNLTKTTYQSAEIDKSQQVRGFRHGSRTSAVAFNGELAAGKYVDFWAAAARAGFSTAPTTGALTNITASATAPHFVRAAGSFITDGFRVGDVMRWSGWASTATANNAKNFLITALTATNMTVVALDGSAVVAKASGDSVTGTLQGKRTSVPATGHTDDSFYFEDWYADITQSEQFSGCKLQNLAVNLAPNAIATMNMNFLGKDIVTDTSQYYTSPTAPTQSERLAGVNGVVLLAGAQSLVVTGMNFTIDEQLTAPPVVGSNVVPAVFRGRATASGQATVYFEDAAVRDAFVNEDVVSVVGAFTASNAADADFVCFNFPNVKFGGASKDDGEVGIIQTLPFTAFRPSTVGTGVLDSTFAIQDSLAV